MAEAGGGGVLLVSMPFSSAHYPNLALGLLKPLVERTGAGCDVRYFSLDYLDALGPDAYSTIAEPALYMAQAGEWVFAAAADERMDANDVSFLTQALRRTHPDAYRPALLSALLAARAGAADFIERCYATVDWGRYAVAGFTTSFQQTMAALALARRVKARHPGVTMVFGGANCQDEMGRALLDGYRWIDAVCLGEGETALPELVRRRRAGMALSGIPGMAVRGGGEPGAAPRTDVSALPPVSFDDFFAQRAHTASAPLYPAALVMETARGCWWGARQHCTFCGLNGTEMAFRAKGQAEALAELQDLVARYGIEDVAFADNILDMRYFEAFLPGIAARDMGLLLFYEVKSNLTEGQIRMLAEAGVKKFQPGIEALDTGLLRLMRKGVTMLHNVQTLKLGAEHGCYVEWNALHGFPGEDPGAYDRSAALLPKLRHLQPPSGFNPVRADRFSPYFTDPGRFGVTLEPLPAYAHLYPDPALIGRIGYHFAMHSPALDEADAHTAAMRREIADWRAHWMESALWWDGRAVHDRRWGLPEADKVLTGEEAALLDACATMANVHELGALAAAAARLIERGWLLEEGGRMLALPLRQPGPRRAPSLAEVRASVRRRSVPGRVLVAA